MNSVERLIEYASFEPEAAPVIPGRRPPKGWPHAGAIQVSSLVLRYSPTSEPVLRGLSFSVGARQKVRLLVVCCEQQQQQTRIGAVLVSSLVLRYVPTSEPVLRGLSFSVGARQKVNWIAKSGNAGLVQQQRRGRSRCPAWCCATAPPRSRCCRASASLCAPGKRCGFWLSDVSSSSTSGNPGVQQWFRALTWGYSPTSEPVLRGLSCSVGTRQKVRLVLV